MRGRLDCGSHCELIPFLEDSFPVPAAEKPQAPPPLLNLYKKKPFPLSLIRRSAPEPAELPNPIFPGSQSGAGATSRANSD